MSSALPTPDVVYNVPEITVAVVDAHSGRGIGRGLLEQLIDTARRLGFEGLSLSVEDGNAARGLYERLVR